MQVADFGLSKEEVYDGRKSGLKGTYGYMDPDYMSTNKLTKKSDVYSFGIILFELITAINPQQGLMDYINLVSHFNVTRSPYRIRKTFFFYLFHRYYHSILAGRSLILYLTSFAWSTFESCTSDLCILLQFI